ncbi:sugar nucleotide-binding protein [Patescibacteria group bacterium]|nr:sugar nucleotide-binding protein [Patescibacteria group bacterium]MBU1967327.1 sugar nucleotide-binding protein [Patescibacteria group bacterium]MBU2543244.1 sugar nucleotide-binding protein [Patescibacteria group bacterium]
MQKIPILTTGLTGLVGSRIAEMLGDRFEFFNMDLTIGVDITDKNKVRDFIKTHFAKVMIHLAAFTDMNAAFEQTDDKQGLCYQVNVIGTKNIAQICKENDIYLIHISTGLVFDGTQTQPYRESDPRNPIEWYGQTKAWAEEEVEKKLTHYAIARIDYPFRAKFTAKPDIVAKIKQGLVNNSLYPQFSDMIITPTYIDDMAQAIEVIIKKQPQGIYQLNNSTSLSTYELAKKVAEIFGFDSKIVKKGSLEEYLKTTNRPYQKTMRISNEKVQRELGLKSMTIDEALKDIKTQLDLD